MVKQEKNVPMILDTKGFIMELAYMQMGLIPQQM